MEEPQLPIEGIRFRYTYGFGKSACEPGWYWDHQIPFPDYDLFYVVNGRGTMRLGDEHFELQPKCCIVMRPGDLPKATMEENDRLVVLFLHFGIDRNGGGGGDPGDEGFFPFPRYTLIEEYVPFENQLQLIMELLDFPSLWADFQFDAMMRLLVLSIYKEHYHSRESHGLSPKQVRTVRKVIRYIRDRQGKDIEYAKLAELAGMNPQYLNRLFKSFTGHSLKEFIVQTKLKLAMTLLEQSTMRISEVAEYLGYADVYTFSKRFKSCHGISPSHYVAQLRPAIAAPGSGGRRQGAWQRKT